MSDKKPQQKINPKIFAILSYLWILCLLPFILNVKDEFVIKHAKQGLVLFIAEIALYAIAIVPVLGWVVSAVGTFIAIIVSILGVLNAIAGKVWVIPYIGKYAEKINI